MQAQLQIKRADSMMTHAGLRHAVNRAVVADPSQWLATAAAIWVLIAAQHGATQGGKILEANGHVRCAAGQTLPPGACIAKAVQDAAVVPAPGSEEHVFRLSPEVPVEHLRAAGKAGQEAGQGADQCDFQALQSEEHFVGLSPVVPIEHWQPAGKRNLISIFNRLSRGWHGCLSDTWQVTHALGRRFVGQGGCSSE